MLTYHNVEQGTEEWHALRIGRLTASNAQAIASNGKGLETLVFEKVAEIMTGKSKDGYTNGDIERGNELESQARNFYEVNTGNVVKQVGFASIDEYIGASPDGLVGDDGLVEIKCPNDANFVRYLFDRKVPSKYNWQMQMQMFVTEREWVDYVVHNENFAETTIIHRVMRNEVEIAKIKAGLDTGVAQIKSILEKVRTK